jgi:Ca-activated chloride channel family protein
VLPMVRAFGLLAFGFGLVLLGACSADVGPAQAPVATKSAAPQEARGEMLYESATAPAADAPAAPAPLAAPASVESLQRTLTQQNTEYQSTNRTLEEKKELGDSPAEGQGPGVGGDKFSHLEENDFLTVKDAPLSTFSIDVDTASYSKARSFLLEHKTMPPADAIRVEELINYFDYDYAGPTDEHPFAVHLETAECPWAPKHRLVRCALQGKKLNGQRPVSNLVFLIDVSGSMNQHNKLPLVQRSLTQLAQQLGENDRVSIVVYAGAAGLVLPPTQGDQHATIQSAIENLRAGGSTNGGQGIALAYKLAQENLIKGGTNRVILCSDGDFNVGVTSPGDLVRMAKEKADLGIYLSVLGFGIGNHNDAMLEELSNKANGNYAFIDTDNEAKKVFVEQLEGTLVTIAKDVKIQVEFNPAQVAAYRLIGYENRKLANRDFNDDKKDAGDIGAGHRVTALYEIVPVGVESDLTKPLVDPLKYQGAEADAPKKPELTEAAKSGELLTLKLRYQPPAGGTSTLMTFPVKDSDHRFAAASQEFQFAASVASFGMLLRDSKYKGNTSYAAVLETAAASKGPDKHGLRNEFLQIVAVAASLASQEGKPIEQAPGTSGAWLKYQPGNTNSFTLPVNPQAPAVVYVERAPSIGIVSTIFLVGLTVGVIAAVFVVLFALGVFSLRSSLLAPRLPPAKMKPKMLHS